MARFVDRQRQAAAMSTGIVVAGGVFVVGTGMPVSAAVITVGGTDVGDPATLEEAVDIANGLPGADTIVFDPSLVAAPLTLINPELRVNDDLSIVGPGADVLTLRSPGNNVLYQYGAASLTVSGLTIDGARESGIRSRSSGGTTVTDVTISSSDGPAIEASDVTDAGPSLVGPLTITGSTLRDNDGGGVHTRRTQDVTIDDVVLERNGSFTMLLSSTVTAPTIADTVVEDAASGILVIGSGLDIRSTEIATLEAPQGNTPLSVRGAIDGEVVISDVTVAASRAVALDDLTGGSAAISNLTTNGSSLEVRGISTSLSITDSEVSAGQILLSDVSSDVLLDNVVISDFFRQGLVSIDHDGDLDVIDTTLTNVPTGVLVTNQTGDTSFVGVTISDVDGAAISASNVTGSFEVINSTVAGALSDTDSPYGSTVTMYNMSGDNRIVNSTISANGRDEAAENDSVIRAAGSLLTISNSVLSGNNVPNVVTNSLNGDPSTVVISDSLIPADAVGAPGTVFDASNVVADDPQLGDLADNGGPTLTMLPLLDSPAVDAGPVVPEPGIATDQRGEARVVGDAIDIGAVERGAEDVLGEISVDDVTVNEDVGSILVTFSRDGGDTGDVFASFSVEGGTAEAGSDFTASFSRVVSWADGESGTKTVRVATAIDDQVVEDAETLIVTLTEVIGATAADDSATVTIIDNDLNAPITSVAPARVVDTRDNGDTVDDLFEGDGLRIADTEYRVAIAGRAGVPIDAKASIVNVTAVGAESVGFVTVHPCLDQRPNASSLNFVPDANTANEVVAPLSADGELCVYTSEDVHVLIDVVGFVDAASPMVPLAPARYLDTRPAGETFDGADQRDGRTSAGGGVTLQIAGRGDVPADAAAVIVNVTAVGPTDAGFVTVHPCVGEPPNASSLNYVAGVNRANELIASVNADGEICLFTSSSIDVLVDVVGYVPTGSSFTPVAPARYLDSRGSGETIDGLDQQMGKFVADSELELQVAGRGDVPVGASAVVVNVTAVAAEGVGFATVHPCVDPRPNASSLNYVSGVNGANELIAQLDAVGKICLYTSEAAHYLVDVVGYID